MLFNYVQFLFLLPIISYKRNIYTLRNWEEDKFIFLTKCIQPYYPILFLPTEPMDGCSVKKLCKDTYLKIKLSFIVLSL